MGGGCQHSGERGSLTESADREEERTEGETLKSVFSVTFAGLAGQWVVALPFDACNHVRFPVWFDWFDLY
jgi:hypothetical protein